LCFWPEVKMANNQRQARHEDGGPKKYAIKPCTLQLHSDGPKKNSLCVGSGAGAGGRQYITVNLDYL